MHAAKSEEPSQVYNIKSFDGIGQKIYITPNYVDNILTIRCLKDTLKIYSFTGIEGQVNILDSNFLEITYSIRVGSNVKLRQMLLLCIHNNKICEALNATSLSSSELTEVYDKVTDSLKLFNEKSIYELKVNLTGDNKNNYKLNAHIHDENISKHDPRTNYNYSKQVVLNFDVNQYIFYSSNEDIREYFTMYDPKTQSEHKQFIWGTIPVISLGKSNYYFIKGEWYEKGTKNYLLKYAYR